MKQHRDFNMCVHIENILNFSILLHNFSILNSVKISPILGEIGF